MNTQEEVLQNVGETFEYASQYIQKEFAIIKLEAAEKTAKSTSAIITLAIIAFLMAMVLIMASIAVGFWMGQILGSYALAFLIITAVYALLTILVYLFQTKLIQVPVLTLVLNSFFD